MRGLPNLGGGGNLGTLFVKITGDATGLLRNLRLAQSGVSSFGFIAQRVIGGVVAGAFTSLTTAIVLSIREYARFNEEMTKSLAIMGDVPEKLKEQLAQQAKDLSEQTNKSATEIAQAYFYLASAGIEAEKALKALPIVTKFAVAGEMNMAQATSLLVDTTNALGLSSKDATTYMKNMAYVGGLLAKANTLANATIQEFAQSIANKAGPEARKLGMSAEELTAALAAFANQGDKGLIAGERLYIVLRELQRASIKNATAFRKMGIEVYDSRGEFKHLYDILAQLEAIFPRLSDKEKRAMLSYLGFQEEAIASFQKLIGSAKFIEETTQKLKEQGNTLDEITTKRLSSFQAKWTMVVNSIKSMMIELGGVIAEVFGKTILESLDKSIRKGGEFREDFEKTLKTVREGTEKITKTYKALYYASRHFRELVGKPPAFFYMLKGGEAYSKELERWAKHSVETMKALREAYDVWFGEKDLSEDAKKSAEEAVQFFSEFAKKTASEIKPIQEGIKSIWQLYEQGPSDVQEAVEKKGDDRVAKIKEILAEYMKGLEQEKNTILDQLKVPTWSDIYGSTYGGGFDWEIVNILYMQDQVEKARAIIDELKALDDEELNLTKEQQEKKYAIIAGNTEKIKQLHIAQARVALQSAEGMFGSLSSIMSAWAGEASGIYKTMFAMSKAFAIADATVKIYQGIANAASLPFPANLAAMAQVAAATASIVQSIMSVRLAFEGREQGGPVEKGKAYIVGEAGPELFVPKTEGTVISNKELKPASVKVVVNNYAGTRVDVNEKEENNERLVEIVLRKVDQELGSRIIEGRGTITRALERTYALNRAYGV